MARIVLLSAWLLLVATTAMAATDRQTRTLPLPPERTLAIEITIGTVRIEGTDRSDIELVIERHAPTEQALSRIPVSIADTPGRILVQGLQADGATNPALKVVIVARVPRRATIDQITILEGGLSIDQFSGRMTAAVRRGPIDGSNVSGSLRLETEIGNVVLSNARLSRDGLLRLRTFNGDVRLSLAERPPDARILALALNGTIKSEIPLASKDTWGPRWGEATLGKGEPVISLDVVTGTIEIRSPR
jgi:DUF4097 and DUF4098 domain-containing protein YvlB